MATQTPYEVLGVKPTPAPTRSARPTASSPRSFTPTSTPASRRPRRGSRRCRPPTTCCPIPRSGRATIAARSTKAAPSGRAIPIGRTPRARRAGSTSRRARWISTISRICSRCSGVAAGRRGARAGAAAQGFAMPGADRHLHPDGRFRRGGDRRQAAPVAGARRMARRDDPARHRGRPGAAAQGQGRPGLRRRPGRRRADRGACRAAPAVPPRRRRHPSSSCRSASPRRCSARACRCRPSPGR